MGAAARVHYHAGVLWLLCLCLWPSAPCADGPHGGQAQKGSDVIAQQETRFHTSETRNFFRYNHLPGVGVASSELT